MFRNCLKFHEKGSEFYNHGKSLEEFLDNFLEQWLPDYAYETHPTFTKIKIQQPEPSTSGTGKKRKKKHSTGKFVQEPFILKSTQYNKPAPNAFWFTY